MLELFFNFFKMNFNPSYKELADTIVEAAGTESKSSKIDKGLESYRQSLLWVVEDYSVVRSRVKSVRGTINRSGINHCVLSKSEKIKLLEKSDDFLQSLEWEKLKAAYYYLDNHK